MNKPKQIQLSEPLFLAICKYFLFNDIEQEEFIKSELNRKLERLKAHDDYYKRHNK